MRTRTSGGVAGGAREGVPYADHIDVVGRVQSEPSSVHGITLSWQIDAAHASAPWHGDFEVDHVAALECGLD